MYVVLSSLGNRRVDSCDKRIHLLLRKATAISALCSCYVGYPRLAGPHHAASRSALCRGQDISERLPPKGPRRYPYCKRHIDCIVPKEIASFVVPKG